MIVMLSSRTPAILKKRVRMVLLAAAYVFGFIGVLAGIGGLILGSFRR